MDQTTLSAPFSEAAQLMIRLREADQVFMCAVCQGSATAERGPGLFTFPDSQPVCPVCAVRLGPVLWALGRLGQTAKQVGRVGLRCPQGTPLTKLLHLAEAAEKFAAKLETGLINR